MHKEAEASTPLKLEQAYAVVELQDKVDVVWGFAKAHLKAKTIVFLSTCKQVRAWRWGGAGGRPPSCMNATM